MRLTLTPLLPSPQSFDFAQDEFGRGQPAFGLAGMSRSDRSKTRLFEERVNKDKLMIGQVISHYKILEKLGEARLRSSNFNGQGGHVLRSLYSILKVPL